MSRRYDKLPKYMYQLLRTLEATIDITTQSQRLVDTWANYPLSSGSVFLFSIYEAHIQSTREF